MKKLISLLMLLMLTAACALAEVPADGRYTVQVTSDSNMFRVTRCVLDIENGQIAATLTLGGTGYGYLFPGTAEEADAAPRESWAAYQEDDAGKYSYTVAISALDADVPVAAYSKKYEKWYDRMLVFDSATLHPLAEKQEMQEAPAAVPGLADGSYAIEVTSDSALFDVTACRLTVEGGAMTAEITAGTDAYAKIFAGKGRDARKAEAQWIAGEPAEGGMRYVLPVSQLDSEMTVSTYSESARKWYDRKLVFLSGTAVPAADEAPQTAQADDPNAVPCALPDGEYVPEAFSFSGGSGKVTISCPRVIVENGNAYAELVFSSGKYGYVRIGETKYFGQNTEKTSTFRVPVRLNEDYAVIGMTSAMSTEREIEYTIFVQLSAAAGDGFGASPVLKMPLRYATQFSVETLEDGVRRIETGDGSVYLLVPEGMEAPKTAGGAVVLQMPLEHIYLAASSTMALVDRLGRLDAVRLTGTKRDDWTIEAARDAMDAGDILFAGKYNEPDYELLIREGCDLALESTMILHTPKIRELLELLGIPVFIDRSSYEPHPLGRLEWVKLYGVLLGREAEAEAFFEEQAARVEALSGAENTGKSVAFFYINAAGGIVVRSPSDYVPKMIALAGGVYAFDGEESLETGSASVTMTPEAFYARAMDADYLVYNSTVNEAPESIDALLARAEYLADLPAVREGRVYAMSSSMYQASDAVAGVIVDLAAMLSGQTEGMTFLTRME